MIEDINNYSDNESDEEERLRFFSVCAENKINAMIARMRESENDNFEGPEEFEKEAVTMAIQQHGLKNCDQSPRDSICGCNCEINENHCNQSLGLCTNCGDPTTSDRHSNEVIRLKGDCHMEGDSVSESVKKNIVKKSDKQELALIEHVNAGNYELNDIDFINEAVAAAIRKKGLSSSHCNALQ